MHTGRNRNKSNLTEKGAKSCLSKIAYKPVLADFTEINGERDFTYHAIEYNDDGSRTYIEKQVGCFTSDKPYMKQDSDHEDRKYIYAKIAIPREYSDAAEIIERKGGTKVSAELCINEMSYSVEDGLLLEDVDVMGVTLLGTDPETGEPVQEGMENAYLQIEDFSADNNSIINKAQLKEEIIAEILNQLDYNRANFADYNYGKEEIPVDKENVNVEFEEANTDEVEVKEEMAETVEVETTEEETLVLEAETSDEDSVKNTDETPEVVDEFADDDASEETTDDEHQSTSAIEDEDSTGTRVENSLTYSVIIDGVKKDFAISLADKINAVTTLVNDTYSESDNTWYYCDVFEDDGRYCVMHDFWGDRHYRQEYSVKKDVYSLKGDRVQVYAQYLTSDEIAKLDKMKSDFSAIETELNSYKEKELYTQREEVINSEDYSVMADFAEFKELKEHMDDYSIDDLTKEADLLYAKFMKSNYSTFAAKPEKKRSMVFMTTGEKSQEERLPYGGLFKNFKGKNN